MKRRVTFPKIQKNLAILNVMKTIFLLYIAEYCEQYIHTITLRYSCDYYKIFLLTCEDYIFLSTIKKTLFDKYPL